MKTSTIVKIVLAILLCIIFLALIGRKTRENFQANQNPIETNNSVNNQFGYEISTEDDNNLSNLPIQNNLNMTISDKDNNCDADKVQTDAINAKNRLDELIKKEVNNPVNNQTNLDTQSTDNQNFDPCSHLSFPGILN